MYSYASNTRSSKNLAALHLHGWRILLTPDNPTPPAGFIYAIDNGAWKAHSQGIPFDEVAFLPLLRRYGHNAAFVVVPDIVGAGLDSLRYSSTWLPRMADLPCPLLAVQDGMTQADVLPLLRKHPRLGLFLGGSTEWKLATIREWGILASAQGRYYHVGRVNTARRIRLCEEAGASSFDGTSASVFSCTVPLLESARQYRNLFNPRQHSPPR